MPCKRCGHQVVDNVKYAKLVKDPHRGTWIGPIAILEREDLCKKCQEAIELKLQMAIKGE